MRILHQRVVQKGVPMSRTRRSFTPAFKAEVALQALRGDKSQAAICREHNLSPDIVTRWKQAVEEHANEIFDTDAKTDGNEVRVLELERLAGQLALELSAAKKLSLILPSRPQRSGK